MNYYFKVWKNYATFSGRARRSEYWYFHLLNVIIIYGLAHIDKSLNSNTLCPIYELAVLVPMLAVSARRTHDVGKSGWFYFIPIYDIILACTDGYRGRNEYGSDPKAGQH